MRTYGRVINPDGSRTWVEVLPNPAGFNDYIYITTLIQCLKLALGESPFYANFGIPAQQAVIQQIFPDFYVMQTQQQFASFFASLTVTKVSSPTPTYNINIVTTIGTKIQAEIAA